MGIERYGRWSEARGGSPLGFSRVYPQAPNQRPDLLPPAVARSVDDLQVEHPHLVDGTSPVVEQMRYGDFANLPLSIGVADQLVLIKPQSKRIFLCICNNHATQSLFVAFGTVSTPALGLKILPGGALTLDSVVPQNDIHIISDGAATNGALVYCNKEMGQN